MNVLFKKYRSVNWSASVLKRTSSYILTYTNTHLPRKSWFYKIQCINENRRKIFQVFKHIIYSDEIFFHFMNKVHVKHFSRSVPTIFYRDKSKLNNQSFIYFQEEMLNKKILVPKVFNSMFKILRGVQTHYDCYCFLSILTECSLKLYLFTCVQFYK